MHFHFAKLLWRKRTIEQDKSRRSFHLTEDFRGRRCNLHKLKQRVKLCFQQKQIHDITHPNTIRTSFAIHHGRGAMMFVAQPGVFGTTGGPEILVVLLRCRIIRGAKDLDSRGATEFLIKDVSFYKHPRKQHQNYIVKSNYRQTNRRCYQCTDVPFAEVSGRKHEVLHLVVVPLRSACRAGRGVCRCCAVLGSATQVVIAREPCWPFLHASDKLKSQQFAIFVIAFKQFFTTPCLAKFGDSHNFLWRFCSSVTYMSFGARLALIFGDVCSCWTNFGVAPAWCDTNTNISREIKEKRMCKIIPVPFPSFLAFNFFDTCDVA